MITWLLAKLLICDNCDLFCQQTRRGRVGDLFTADLRMTTLLLWFIWFANTFCYYGIVLVTTELLGIQDNNICDGEFACTLSIDLVNKLY